MMNKKINIEELALVNGGTKGPYVCPVCGVTYYTITGIAQHSSDYNHPSNQKSEDTINGGATVAW